MIKNLAMMGVATGNGCIYVTDMDRIERSNLSRQFLFRNSDIGHSKSETAVRVVKQMNPSIHALAYEVKVGPDTEDVFTDQFMDLICRQFLPKREQFLQRDFTVFTSHIGLQLLKSRMEQFRGNRLDSLLDCQKRHNHSRIAVYINTAHSNDVKGFTEITVSIY